MLHQRPNSEAIHPKVTIWEKTTYPDMAESAIGSEDIAMHWSYGRKFEIILSLLISQLLLQHMSLELSRQTFNYCLLVLNVLPLLLGFLTRGSILEHSFRRLMVSLCTFLSMTGGFLLFGVPFNYHSIGDVAKVAVILTPVLSMPIVRVYVFGDDLLLNICPLILAFGSSAMSVWVMYMDLLPNELISSYSTTIPLVVVVLHVIVELIFMIHKRKIKSS